MRGENDEGFYLIGVILMSIIGFVTQFSSDNGKIIHYEFVHQMNSA